MREFFRNGLCLTLALAITGCSNKSDDAPETESDISTHSPEQITSGLEDALSELENFDIPTDFPDNGPIEYEIPVLTYPDYTEPSYEEPSADIEVDRYAGI